MPAARRTAFVLTLALPLAFVAGRLAGGGGAPALAAPSDPAAGGALAPLAEGLDEGEVAVRIRAAVDAILAEPDLPPAHWGIYVRDLTTGRAVYALDADRLFLPASNLKILTTATALDVLGAGHRFATRLYFGGETTPDGTLRGDLVVRGSGDPTLGSRYFGGDPFEAWAESLRDAGVRRIEGRLVGDDDVFEEYPYAAGWDVSHIGVEEYAAPAGGLSYGDNLVDVEVRGGQAEVDPAGFVDVRVVGGRGPLRVAWAPGTGTIEVSGSGSTARREIPIEEPTAFALHALRAALAEAGITVTGASVDADDLGRRPDYAALGQPLLAHLSPPLADIVGHTNRRSDNFYAEQLFRALSPDGTRARAADRVRAFIEGAGVEAEGLSVRDGSGLSRKDLVTPRAFVGLLAHMDRHPARSAFLSSLPAGGEPQSTLGSRLRDVQVRAKTGSLDFVRGLSGYVTGPDGHRLAFSILANHFTSGGGRIAGATDRIVRALATGTRVPAEEEGEAAPDGNEAGEEDAADGEAEGEG